MCDYTQVEYACGHLRFLVRAWCVRYQESHKRCQPNVVAIEQRLDERCGDCRDPPIPIYLVKKRSKKAMRSDENQSRESISPTPTTQSRRY